MPAAVRAENEWDTKPPEPGQSFRRAGDGHAFAAEAAVDVQDECQVASSRFVAHVNEGWFAGILARADQGMSSGADDSAGCLQVRRTEIQSRILRAVEIQSRILRAVASRCEWDFQEVASLAAAAPGTYNCSESARMESSGLLDFALAGVRRFHSVRLMPGALSLHPLCGW